MSRQMTKLMPWVGGKAQLMWAIQMLLPTHYKTLVDVFGGSGIITMNTSVPSGCLQIYNDLNHDLYNLLFCAKERPLELVRELGFLPINAHDGAESYVSSKEDSLERLIYSAKCQFADDAEGVEDAVIRKDNLRRLRAALDQLSEEERVLIHALFFDERSERELEEMMGVHRMTIHNRKIRILQKLKKMLR